MGKKKTAEALVRNLREKSWTWDDILGFDYGDEEALKVAVAALQSEEKLHQRLSKNALLKRQAARKRGEKKEEGQPETRASKQKVEEKPLPKETVAANTKPRRFGSCQIVMIAEIEV